MGTAATCGDRGLPWCALRAAAAWAATLAAAASALTACCSSCGVLDEFLAARLLSRADQLLGSRAALMARARTAVERWIAEQDGRQHWLRP